MIVLSYAHPALFLFYAFSRGFVNPVSPRTAAVSGESLF